MARLRVQFIHGLEGSPQGAKARLLARHFETLTPAMETSDFGACVAVQADALAAFRPDVLVGSSFGAAVAVELLQRGLWRGATLLLAQAALRRGARAELPPGVPVWLVHGLRDQLIDIEDSRRAAWQPPARRSGWCSSRSTTIIHFTRPWRADGWWSWCTQSQRGRRETIHLCLRARKRRRPCHPRSG
jgi:pimeloyl-ACP methyl ester carboxylesterase